MLNLQARACAAAAARAALLLLLLLVLLLLLLLLLLQNGCQPGCVLDADADAAAAEDAATCKKMSRPGHLAHGLVEEPSKDRAEEASRPWHHQGAGAWQGAERRR